jgi:hypothetical protein
MTEVPGSNITKLPRKPLTSTQRSKAHRERAKAAARDAAALAAAPAATPATTPATPPVPAATSPATPRQRDGASAWVTLAAALAVATVSAFFAVTGSTRIFPGAFWPVVAMGVALEGSKLAAIGWLGRRQGATPLRAVIVALVAIMMALSGIGAFGFLSSAHIDHVASHRAAVDQRAAEIEARAKVQAVVIGDIDTRIAQIDSAIAETIRRGRAAAAMALRDTMQRDRAALVQDRDREVLKRAGIDVEAARVRSDRDQQASADDGPVTYIAELIGIDADTAAKYFIALVSILLDPLAAALLLASTRRSRTP